MRCCTSPGDGVLQLACTTPPSTRSTGISAAMRPPRGRDVEPRTAFVVLLFAAFTFCTASGLLLFKHAWPAFHAAWTAGLPWTRHALFVVTGAALYGISFLLWLVIVSRLPLTVGDPESAAG